MNSLLAVGQGSEHESRTVIMRWNGGKKGAPPVGFIGKGDTLLVLSDGTFEVDGPTGDQLGVEALADHCTAQPGDLTEIFDWVRTLNGGGTLPDDFSLLKISF